MEPFLQTRQPWEAGDLPPCLLGLPRTRQWPDRSGTMAKAEASPSSPPDSHLNACTIGRTVIFLICFLFLGQGIHSFSNGKLIFFCRQDEESIGCCQKEIVRRKPAAAAGAAASIPCLPPAQTKFSLFRTEELPPLVKITSASTASWFLRQRYVKQKFSESQAYLLSLTPGQDVWKWGSK